MSFLAENTTADEWDVAAGNATGDAYSASAITADNTSTSLSPTQQQVLALLTVGSACASILGSLQILYMVLSNRKCTPYRRILCGMSVCDIVFSLDLGLQSFLLPAGSWAWAIGNNTTCTIAGFGLQLGFSALWYNAMLSLYFLLTVKYGIPESVIAKKYEPYMHACPFAWGLVTACVGLGSNAYGRMKLGLRCWVTIKYPALAWVIGGIPLFFVFIMIVACNLLVYCHVRQTTRRSRQYHHSYHSSTAAMNTASAMMAMTSSRHQSQPMQDDNQQSETIQSSPGRNPHHISTSPLPLRFKQSNVQQQRVEAVATQAFCYVAAYVLVNSLSLIQTLLGAYVTDNQVQMFPLVIMTAFLYPMQGLLNMIIYARPSYMRARREFPLETKLWAFRRALYGDRIAPQYRIGRTPESSSSSYGPNHLPHGDSTDNGHRQRLSLWRWSTNFDSHLFYPWSGKSTSRRPMSSSNRPSGGVLEIDSSNDAPSRPFGISVSDDNELAMMDGNDIDVEKPTEEESQTVGVVVLQPMSTAARALEPQKNVLEETALEDDNDLERQKQKISEENGASEIQVEPSPDHQTSVGRPLQHRPHACIEETSTRADNTIRPLNESDTQTQQS